MRLSYLAYTFSLSIMYFSVLLLVPILIALYYHETSAIFPFFFAATVAFLIAVTLKKIVPGASQVKNVNDINKSEGICTVTFCWLLAGLLAAIPYMFFGFSFIDALFESTSGITTTGSTIFVDYNFPKALFFWRGFTQWIGGMGIIVLFVAILPQFAIAGRQLFFAEAPGPTEDKFTPRVRNTASALWKVYLGMTILEIVLLRINGMSGFNAMCHSFSSVSGGGLSPNSYSLVGSTNIILWIMAVFTFFGGASYNLQYKAWTKLNPLVLFKSEEFRVYFWITVGIGLLLALSLEIHEGYGVFNSLTHSFFNVCSVISSSGFCSVDFAKWDYVSKVLLFIAMATGSCASSAGGGIKIMRWLLIFKIMKTELTKVLHPKAVFNIKVENCTVPREILYQTLMFVSFYFAILICSTLVTAMIEKSTVIGLTGTVSSLGNIGPGLGNVIGPLGSYQSLNIWTKIIFIIDMFVGRLELIPFLVLFQKDLWSFK